MRYLGYFSTFGDTDHYTVEIITNGSSAQTTEILLSGDHPVVYEYSSDGLFAPIKSRSCTVRMVSESYRFDMYSAKAHGVEVIVRHKNPDYIEFRGWVTPAIYSQDYLKRYDTIEIECIDALSTLQYFPYEQVRPDAQKTIRTFREYIETCLDKVGYTEYYWPEHLQCTDRDGGLLDRLGLREHNLFDDDADATPWNLNTVLAEICKFLGVTAVPYRNAVYFISYPAINAGHSRYSDRTNNTNILLSNVIELNKDSYRDAGAQIDLTETYNKVSISCNEYKIKELTPDIFDDYNKSDHTAAISLYGYDGYFYKEWQSIMTQNNIAGVTWFVKYYKPQGLEYTTHWSRPNQGGGWESGFNPLVWSWNIGDEGCPFVNSSIIGNYIMDSSQSALIGCLPISKSENTYDWEKENLGGQISFKNKLLFSLGYQDYRVETPLYWNKKCITIHTGQYILRPQSGQTTYIIINGLINFIYEKVYRIRGEEDSQKWVPFASSVLNEKVIKETKDEYAHYPLFCYELSVGDATWEDVNPYATDPTQIDYHKGGKWYKTTNRPPIPKVMFSKGMTKYAMNTDIQFDNTVDYLMGLDTEGYAIPITRDDDVYGEVNLTIYCPYISVYGSYTKSFLGTGLFSKRKYNYKYDRFPPFAEMSDLKIDIRTVDTNYNPLYESMDQDDDILYESDINVENVPEFDELELKVNTQRPDREMTASAVILDRKEYLDRLYDKTDSTDKLQEEHLLGHLVEHYCDPKVKLTMTTRNALIPYTHVTYPSQFGNRNFMIDTQRVDLKGEKNEITLEEY